MRKPGNTGLSDGAIGIKKGIKPVDVIFAAILLRYFGWGGRIRTFTILINSEVSYRLDHAPAGTSDCSRKNRSR